MITLSQVSFAAVCYLPTTFTVKHDIHSTAYVKTQSECENLCTAATEVSSINSRDN